MEVKALGHWILPLTLGSYTQVLSFTLYRLHCNYLKPDPVFV